MLDVFFGVDYHSHLGTRRAGMVFYDNGTFQRQIHSIENAPFRTKFEDDLVDFHGNSGIGCISDTDPQPLLVRSHLGVFGITTVGAINNADQLIEDFFADGGKQFMAMGSTRSTPPSSSPASSTARTTWSRASSSRRRPSTARSRCSS